MTSKKRWTLVLRIFSLVFLAEFLWLSGFSAARHEWETMGTSLIIALFWGSLMFVLHYDALNDAIDEANSKVRSHVNKLVELAEEMATRTRKAEEQSFGHIHSTAWLNALNQAQGVHLKRPTVAQIKKAQALFTETTGKHANIRSVDDDGIEVEISDEADAKDIVLEKPKRVRKPAAKPATPAPVKSKSQQRRVKATTGTEPKLLEEPDAKNKVTHQE